MKILSLFRHRRDPQPTEPLRPVPAPATSKSFLTDAASPRLAPVASGIELPGFDERATRVLLSVASLKQANAGDVLLRAGDPSDTLCVIVQGAAQLTTGAAEHASPVAVLYAGDCLGDLGSGAPREMPFSLTAVEPCRWLSIPRSAVTMLPTTIGLALYKWIASSSLARFQALLAEQTARTQVAGATLARIQAHQRQVAACVASSMVQDVLAGIPKLPPFATDLLNQLLDDHSNTEAVVSAIQSDPALAALVLKTVNSPYYGLTTKISDYYHAFLHLGSVKVFQLIVAAGIEGILPPTPEAREVQAHSQVISLIANEIARLSNVVRPEVAATIGLLHDVGICLGPVMRRHYPAVAPLVDLLPASGLGASLLARWGLPERVVRAVEFQDAPAFCPPDRADPEWRNEVGILHISHLCYDLLVGHGTFGASPPHARAYLAAVGLPGLSHLELCRTHIAPAMARHAKELPLAIRELLRLDLPGARFSNDSR